MCEITQERSPFYLNSSQRSYSGKQKMMTKKMEQDKVSQSKTTIEK